MEWPEDIARELPAPRADEPPELRRRIVAEVRDHLETSLQRELLRTGDAVQARHNVLDRFGDPVRLARKLWFDALWEKIMIQRGMLVALVAMVVVSAGSLGLSWFMVMQAGQVNQGLLEQSRTANESILAKLQALGSGPGEAGPKTAEWFPLKFRVTWDKSDGAPAARVKIAIQGQAYTAGAATALERTTGPDGIADFGLVRPGQYLVNAVTPSGETIADSTSLGMGIIELSGHLITLSPGQSQTQELVCPYPPQDAEISLSVDWPQELSGRPLWLVCEFARQPRDIGGHKWATSEPQKQFVVVDPAGTLASPDMRSFGKGAVSTAEFFPTTESIHVDEESRSFVKNSKSFVDTPGVYRIASSWAIKYGRADDGRFPVYIWLPNSNAISQLKWPAGTYAISRLIVGREEASADASLPNDLRHLEFLVAIGFARTEQFPDELVYPNEDRARNSTRKRREVRADVPRFEASPGERNEWRLPIPPRLVDVLTEPEPEARETDEDNADPTAATPVAAPAPSGPSSRSR